MIRSLLKRMLIEDVIFIDAPQREVWLVTIDIELWPQWTPTVTAVKRLDKGQFGRGSAALIAQAGLPEAKWVVTALTPGEHFTWESRIRGIRLIASHELSTQEAGTRSVLRVEMEGALARLLWPLIRLPARRSLQQENAGLKARCESIGSG